MALDTKKFMTRTASAAVFVVLLLGCVWFNPITLLVFFTLVGLIGLWEFYRLANRLGKTPFRPIGFFLHLASVGMLLFCMWNNFFSIPPAIIIALILAGPVYLLVELFKPVSSVFNTSGVLMGFLYITIPCLLLIYMGVKAAQNSLNGFEPYRVLGMIFFIWINDTGAYLVGSFIGKHKMYERISPGKTWEGTAGGIILAFAFSFLMVKIFPQLELQDWMVIAVLVGIFGTLGDLVESMLKRLAGVKDSGNIMPGHGGVLDRFDSLIFVTPFVFAYLAISGKI